MADRFSRSLSWQEWHRHLEDLALACAGASVCNEAELLRKLHNLLNRVPDPALLDGLHLHSRVQLEALIDIGMCQGAFLAMLGTETVFVASRGRGNSCLVSVSLPGQSSEDASFGSSLVIAGIHALVDALTCLSVASPVNSWDASRSSCTLH